MVAEAGTIAILFMWNYQCTGNKFVFEGTETMTDFTVAFVTT